MKPILKMIAQEGIEFQRDSFTTQLDIICEKLLSFIRDRESLSRKLLGEMLSDSTSEFGLVVTDLKNLIQHRFGLDIDLDFNSSVLAAAETFTVPNIFKVDIHKHDLTLQMKEGGTVDTKNAKVGGSFSKPMGFKLHFDMVAIALKLGLSARQLAATIMHEIGHIFGNLEYCTKMEKINMVLAEVSRKFKDKPVFEKSKYIYIGISDAMELEKDPKILESESKVMIDAGIVEQYLKGYRSQLAKDGYTRTSNEQSADQFATRFGYGQDLVTGLVILHKFMDENYVPPTLLTLAFISLMMALRTFVIVALFTTAIAGLILGPVGVIIAPLVLLNNAFVIIALFSILYFTLNVLTYGSSTPLGMAVNEIFGKYDKLEVRFKRIREQYIEQLKKADLPKKEIENLVVQIRVIDQVMINSKALMKVPTFTKVLGSVFNWMTGNRDNEDLQRNLEELANNDIFLKAAQLKTLH